MFVEAKKLNPEKSLSLFKGLPVLVREVLKVNTEVYKYVLSSKYRKSKYMLNSLT
jgi:hypothetical protein